MIAYRATLGRIHLRLCAQHLQSEPGEALKVVVQVVERGQPIAEDPIHTERMMPLDLARALHISRFDGWELTPWQGAA